MIKVLKAHNLCHQRICELKGLRARECEAIPGIQNATRGSTATALGCGVRGSVIQGRISQGGDCFVVDPDVVGTTSRKRGSSDLRAEELVCV